MPNTEQRRVVAAGEVDVPAHETIASRRVWEIYYLVAIPAAIGVVLLAGDDPARSAVAAGIATLIGAGYALIGRRLDPFAAGFRIGPAIAYQVVTLLLFAVAVRLEFWAGMLLASLCPMAYLSVGLWWGHTFIVALSVLPIAGAYGRSGDLPGALVDVGPWSLATIVFSMFLALAVSRVERRSAQHAALAAELRATRAEVARLAHAAGAAEERGRLAGDIHDTVAQGLNSIALLVEAADRTLRTEPDLARRHLSTAGRVARENLQETRALVGALTPVPLADSTLSEALHRLGRQAGAEASLDVAVEVCGAGPALPTGVEVALLRAAQEALTNVRRHAGATRAWVTLERRDGVTALTVRDPGRGFDTAALPAGYGIAAMRDRVERAGGRLALTSAAGAGTTVRVEFDA